MIAVGGMSNHAHVFFALPATITLAKVMMNMKANSSRWMGERGIKFAWQKGYGAFSVSSSHVEAVTEYVKHQREHHKKRSFEDEFIALLKRYGVDYDPRYVFG